MDYLSTKNEGQAVLTAAKKESKCFIEEQSDYQCFCSHGNNSSRGVDI
jgi:hypothetical protein